MSHPYQCLCYCQQSNQPETGIIVGASGSCIRTFSAQTGIHLSTWPSLGGPAQTRSIGQNYESESETPHLKSPLRDDDKPPLKRQKLSPARDESGSSSAEIVVAGDSDNGELSSPQRPSIPPVTELASTSISQHVVAVTGEDKCIRVFDLAADGTLTQLSERQDILDGCVTISTDSRAELCQRDHAQ